jgi:hypothetical protein
MGLPPKLTTRTPSNWHVFPHPLPLHDPGNHVRCQRLSYSRHVPAGYAGIPGGY